MRVELLVEYHFALINALEVCVALSQRPIWGSKPEPPKIPSADQRGLSRARSMG